MKLNVYCIRLHNGYIAHTIQQSIIVVYICKNREITSIIMIPLHWVCLNRLCINYLLSH